MAAGEDEAQAIVFDAFVVPRLRIVGISHESPVDIVGQRLESGAPANCVYGFEPTRRYQPGARIGRHTIAWPLLQSGPECVVQRLLGDIEVAEQVALGGDAKVYFDYDDDRTVVDVRIPL